jgi:molybdopterin-biosynthesis enzyme MoeA-like protein
MTHDDLTSPVAAEATAQVKLCEPHIWFRLIEAQFALVGIKSQKLKYAMPLPACPSKSFVTFWILFMFVTTLPSRSTF